MNHTKSEPNQIRIKVEVKEHNSHWTFFEIEALEMKFIGTVHVKMFPY